MPTDSQTIAVTARKGPISRHFTICNQKQSATQRESRIKPRKMPPFRRPSPNISGSISFRLTVSNRPFTIKRRRRDISTSHCDSCGFDSLLPATATSRGSVRSRGRAIAKAGVNIYACTVSPSMARETITYIESQPEHHKRLDFNAEIRTICEESGFSCHPDDLN